MMAPQVHERSTIRATSIFTPLVRVSAPIAFTMPSRRGGSRSHAFVLIVSSIRSCWRSARFQAGHSMQSILHHPLRDDSFTNILSRLQRVSGICLVGW